MNVARVYVSAPPWYERVVTVGALASVLKASDAVEMGPPVVTRAGGPLVPPPRFPPPLSPLGTLGFSVGRFSAVGLVVEERQPRIGVPSMVEGSKGVAMPLQSQ